MISKLSDHKFHFVGVGGIGMCGLAELLHNMGPRSQAVIWRAMRTPSASKI